MQVEPKIPVGQTARAARTQPSHLPLLTLIVAPEETALSEKSAVPELPVVAVGEPPHFVMAFTLRSQDEGEARANFDVPIPPQMPSSATF